LVQFNKCSNSILQDFSVENPKATSWPEDNVSAFESSNITIQRGLIDGNNSPTGVGIMFEQSDGVTSGGKAIDVDAVRMGNGCFFAYPGRNITFQRTRCRDNICTSQGRGAPTSAGLAWGGSPESNNLQVLDSKHKNLCGGLAWDASRFNTLELTEQDFTLRAPQRLSFCWNPPAQ